MKQLAKLFTFLVLVLTTAQGFVPSMPIDDPQTLKYISGGLLFAVSVLTTWKQFALDEISNKSLIPTLIVAVVATLAGVLDLLGKLPVDAHTAQWLRFGITFITAILNISSKTFFPGTAAIVVILVMLVLNGCFVGKLIKSDCQVQYSAPISDLDSSSYVCLKCKNKLLIQTYDSIAVKFLKK